MCLYTLEVSGEEEVVDDDRRCLSGMALAARRLLEDVADLCPVRGAAGIEMDHYADTRTILLLDKIPAELYRRH